MSNTLQQPLHISKRFLKSHIPSLDGLVESVLFASDFKLPAGIDEAERRSRIDPAAHLVKDAKIQATQQNQAVDDVLFKSVLTDGVFNALNERTGELIVIDHAKQRTVDPDKGKHERYRLLRTAQDILRNTRTSKCNKHLNGGDHVKIKKIVETGTAVFSGLQTCGSVWSCPVCASKITEKRRLIVQELNAAHKAQGGSLAFVTYTFPHTAQDDVKALLKKLSAAMAFMKAHREYKAIRNRNFQIGTLRALEVTHGSNGWHPHIHEIWYTDFQVEYSALQSDLYTVWRNACLCAGLPEPSLEYGVHVQNGDFVEAYIAKWGKEPDGDKWSVDQEITKQHIKIGKKHGRSPFQILRDAGEGSVQSRQLFKQYAEAFKGQRQLFWSRGLRDRYGIEDKTDEQLAAEQLQDAEDVITMTKQVWKCVISHSSLGQKTHYNDSRSVLLQLAQVGREPLKAYIEFIILESGATPLYDPDSLTLSML